MNGSLSPERPHECPNIKTRILQRYGKIGLTTWHEIGTTQSTKDHSLCTEDKCLANDRAGKQHAATHRTPECDCSCMGLDPQKLAQLFSNGSLPLVRLRRGGQHVLVEVEAYSTGNSFIAISHAQSDGPSSQDGNALPACQLERLFESAIGLARRLGTNDSADQEGVLIWVDILRIPQSEVKSVGVSSEAILAMQQVGSLASAVLVLDSDICKLGPDSGCQKKMICMESSSWGSRLWTLYEALQARRLFFQFQDATFELAGIKKEGSSGHRLERAMIPDIDVKALLLAADADLSKHWHDLERALVGRRVDFTRDAYAVFALMLNKPLPNAMRLCEISESIASMSNAELCLLYKKIIEQLRSIEGVE